MCETWRRNSWLYSGPKLSGVASQDHLRAQSCRTLCDPTDCSPPGSPVHGILQARRLEWVAVSSSRGSSSPRDWTPGLLHLQAESLPSEPPKEGRTISKSTPAKTFYANLLMTRGSYLISLRAWGSLGSRRWLWERPLLSFRANCVFFSFSCILLVFLVVMSRLLLRWRKDLCTLMPAERLLVRWPPIEAA